MVKGSGKEIFVKVFSVIITCFILCLLILSGPAQAFVLSLNIPDNEASRGEIISFTGDVEINSDENLPIENLELTLTGPETINCLFYSNGTIISGCKDISINLSGTAGYEYGYGYGYYGYGYDFGYGYGYTNGLLSYNFTLNTTNYTSGEYSTELKAIIDSREFSNPGENIYILEPVNITNLDSTPDCAYETDNIMLSANITGSILESWLEINITNNITNYSTSSVGDIYSADANLPPGTFYWRFVVKDIAGNLHYSEWQSKYIVSRTILTVSPVTPNGLNGWYTVEPEWTLTNPDAINLWYRWNGNPRINYTETGPFGLENIPNPDKESAGTMKLRFAADIDPSINPDCGLEEWTQEIFYIDLTSPLITNLVPENDTLIHNTLKPTISAYLDEVYQSNSGIDESSIIMKLDNTEITPVVTDYNLDRLLVYYPATALTEGEHEAYVYAKDNSGRESELAWDFKINLTAIFNLTIYSPKDTVYNSKRILFNITTTEEVEQIEYINWNDRKPRWKTLCRRCDDYGFSRKKTKILNEGENNLTIRATDKNGNNKEENLALFIDSQKPRISKTLPRKNKVVNGSEFYIKYTEDNLQNITLFYGEDKITKYSCTSGKNQECTFNDVNLSAYEGQWIEFWFSVSDKINTVESRKTKVFVDTKYPALTINSPVNNANFTSRKVPFNITINEEVKLEYIDNSDKNPRWRTISTRTEDYGNSRKKTKTFKKGTHNIMIKATDKAGNSDIKEISFELDY